MAATRASGAPAKSSLGGDTREDGDDDFDDGDTREGGDDEFDDDDDEARSVCRDSEPERSSDPTSSSDAGPSSDARPRSDVDSVSDTREELAGGDDLADDGLGGDGDWIDTREAIETGVAFDSTAFADAAELHDVQLRHRRPSRWGRVDLSVAWRRAWNVSSLPTTRNDAFWLVATWRR